MTAVIDTTRSLMLGGAVAHTLFEAIASMIIIVAIFAPLAIGKYRKRT